MTRARITTKNVTELAGIDDALASFYAGAIAAAAGPHTSEREIRQWIEDDLISADGFRKPSRNGPGEHGDEVLTKLENAHLIRADKRQTLTWYELSHDRLVAPILDANTTWRDRNLSMLQHRANEWERASKPDGLLISGDVLVEAQEWARDNEGKLSRTDREYLDKCTNAKVAAGRLRLLAIVASAMLVLAVLGLVLALILRSQADAARADAEEQATRAEAALQTADEQKAIAEGALGDAEQQRIRAETEAEAATAAQQEAERQAKLAADAADAAQQQEQIARDALDDAVAAREFADQQKAIADENATQAAAAEARAVALREQEEQQRAAAERSAAEARAAEQRAEDALAATKAAEATAVDERNKAVQAQQAAEAAKADALQVLKSIVATLKEAQGGDFPIFGVPLDQTGGCDEPVPNSTLGNESILGDFNAINLTSSPIDVMWISPNGNKILWETLQPGEGLILLIVSGWVWEATDSAGNCIGVIAY